MDVFRSFIFICLTLIFFNSTYAVCVPRNVSTPNKKPVSPTKSPSSPPPSSHKKSSPPPSSKEKSPSPSKSPSGGKQFKRPILNALSANLPKPGGDGNPAIKKICDSTDYPDVCMSTLGSFKGPGDIPVVLGAAIKAGLDLAKTALDEAEKLATQPGTPADQASLYKDCKDSYDDAEYNFQRAVEALPVNDVGTMNTMLSAALTDVGDCQDAFQGKDCPLATYSDKLNKMASNCLAIVSLIH